jgi:hypothetical protein
LNRGEKFVLDRAAENSYSSGIMIRKLTSTLLIGAAGLLAVAALANTPARSKKAGCEEYARSAVHDYQSMRDHPECHVPDSPRWQPNYQNHYKWCMGVPAAARIGEAKARDAHLVHCKVRSSY